MTIHTSSQRLGDLLLEAREARGLSLDDLVAKTDVRRSYLIALESGHYEALPEAAKAKKALRLYAQSVGLDATRTLHIYRQEQRQAESNGVAETSSKEVSATEQTPHSRERTARPMGPRLGAFGRFATTLMLVVGVVAVALWGFNALLFQPIPIGITQGVSEPPANADAVDTATPAQVAPTTSSTPAAAPTPDLILLSVNTTPPGAEVRIDGLPFNAVSPILDAPVSAGAERTIEVSLPGYESVEQTVDLTRNRNLNLSLSPVIGAVEVADTPADTRDATSAQGTAVLVANAPAWLEVYRGSAREGEPLYYGTAGAGETLTFDLPVYVHTGNGGGVSLAVNGEDRGALGTSGQVTGRALP